MTINVEGLRGCIATLRRIDPKEFDIRSYTHPCGTPACILGHHYFERGIMIGTGLIARARQEFGLTYDQADELFEHAGCGRAKTPQEAIAYIEDFIKRNAPEPVQRPTSALVADLMAKVEATPFKEGAVQSVEYAN